MLSPNLFMWVITALFGMSAVRHLVDLNWPQVVYATAAAALNLAVIYMGAK